MKTLRSYSREAGFIQFIALIAIVIVAVAIPVTVKVINNPQQLADIRNKAMEAFDAGSGGGHIISKPPPPRYVPPDVRQEQQPQPPKPPALPPDERPSTQDVRECWSAGDCESKPNCTAWCGGHGRCNWTCEAPPPPPSPPPPIPRQIRDPDNPKIDYGTGLPVATMITPAPIPQDHPQLTEQEYPPSAPQTQPPDVTPAPKPESVPVESPIAQAVSQVSGMGCYLRCLAEDGADCAGSCFGTQPSPSPAEKGKGVGLQQPIIEPSPTVPPAKPTPTISPTPKPISTPQPSPTPSVAPAKPAGTKPTIASVPATVPDECFGSAPCQAGKQEWGTCKRAGGSDFACLDRAKNSYETINKKILAAEAQGDKEAIRMRADIELVNTLRDQMKQPGSTLLATWQTKGVKLDTLGRNDPKFLVFAASLQYDPKKHVDLAHLEADATAFACQEYNKTSGSTRIDCGAWAREESARVVAAAGKPVAQKPAATPAQTRARDSFTIAEVELADAVTVFFRDPKKLTERQKLLVQAAGGDLAARAKATGVDFNTIYLDKTKGVFTITKYWNESTDIELLVDQTKPTAKLSTVSSQDISAAGIVAPVSGSISLSQLYRDKVLDRVGTLVACLTQDCVNPENTGAYGFTQLASILGDKNQKALKELATYKPSDGKKTIPIAFGGEKMNVQLDFSQKSGKTNYSISIDNKVYGSGIGVDLGIGTAAVPNASATIARDLCSRLGLLGRDTADCEKKEKDLMTKGTFTALGKTAEAEEKKVIADSCNKDKTCIDAIKSNLDKGLAVDLKTNMVFVPPAAVKKNCSENQNSGAHVQFKDDPHIYACDSGARLEKEEIINRTAVDIASAMCAEEEKRFLGICRTGAIDGVKESIDFLIRGGKSPIEIANITAGALKEKKGVGQLLEPIKVLELEKNIAKAREEEKQQIDQNQRETYARYRREVNKPNLTDPEIEKIQTDAWNRVKTNYKNIGIEEALTDQIRRREVLATDLEKEWERNTDFFNNPAKALAATVNNITGGALVRLIGGDEITRIRTDGLIASQTEAERLRNLDAVEKSPIYREWKQGKTNPTPEEFQKEQVAALIGRDVDLRDVGVIRDDTFGSLLSQVLRGEVDAAQVSKNIEKLNIFEQAEVKIYHGLKDFLVVGGASRMFGNSPAKEAETHFAADRIYRDIEYYNPIQAAALVKTNGSRDAVIAHLSKAIEMEDKAASGELVSKGVSAVVSSDTGWLRNGVLSGKVDIRKLNESTLTVDRMVQAYTDSLPEEKRKALEDGRQKELAYQQWKRIPGNEEKTDQQFLVEQFIAMGSVRDDVANILSAKGEGINAKDIFAGKMDFVQVKKDIDNYNPVERIALGVNNYTNGSLLQGQQLRYEAEKRMDDQSLPLGERVAALYDESRGAVMMTAKPVSTVLMLVPGAKAFQLANAGVKLLTVPVVLNVGGSAAGLYFTGDSLQQTAHACAFGHEMDGGECARSVAMKAFAGLSSVKSIQQAGAFVRQAQVAKEVAALNAVSDTSKAAEGVHKATEAFKASFQKPGLFDTVNHYLGPAVFGANAVAVCSKESINSDNCQLSLAMAGVSLARLTQPRQAALNPNTRAVEYIQKADATVNFAQAAAACAAVAAGAAPGDQCASAFGVAGLSAGGLRRPGPDQQGKAVGSRVALEKAIADVESLSRQPEHLESTMKEATLRLQTAIIETGKADAQAHALAKDLSTEPENQTRVERAFTEAASRWRGLFEKDGTLRASDGPESLMTPEKIDAARMALYAADSAMWQEMDLRTNPRSALGQTIDQLRGNADLKNFEAKRQAFEVYARDSSVDPAGYKEAFNALAAAREKLDRGDWTKSQQEVMAELKPLQEEQAKLEEEYRKLTEENASEQDAREFTKRADKQVQIADEWNAANDKRTTLEKEFRDSGGVRRGLAELFVGTEKNPGPVVRTVKSVGDGLSGRSLRKNALEAKAKMVAAHEAREMLEARIDQLKSEGKPVLPDVERALETAKANETLADDAEARAQKQAGDSFRIKISQSIDTMINRGESAARQEIVDTTGKLNEVAKQLRYEGFTIQRKASGELELISADATKQPTPQAQQRLAEVSTLLDTIETTWSEELSKNTGKTQNRKMAGPHEERADQSRIFYDAVFDASVKDGITGVLYDGSTGLGKSAFLLNAIADVKAKLTGSKVHVVATTFADVQGMMAQYPPEVHARNGVKTVYFDIQKREVTYVDGQGNRRTARGSQAVAAMASADVVYSATTDTPYEHHVSRRSDALTQAFLTATKGSVLLVDEFELILASMRFSSGGKKIAVIDQQPEVIKRFGEIYHTDEVKTLVDAGIAEKNTGGRSKLFVDDSGGVRLADTNEAQELYKNMALKAAEQSYNATKSLDDPSFEQWAIEKDITDTKSLDMYRQSSDASKAFIDDLHVRLSSVNAIVSDVGRPTNSYGRPSPGADLVYGDGTGRLQNTRPQDPYAALSLDTVGHRIQETLDGRAVSHEAAGSQISRVTVSEQGETATWKQLLTGNHYSGRVYGFSGTPEGVVLDARLSLGMDMKAFQPDRSSVVQIFGDQALRTRDFQWKEIDGIGKIALADLEKGEAARVIVDAADTDRRILEQRVIDEGKRMGPDVEVIVINNDNTVAENQKVRVYKNGQPDTTITGTGGRTALEEFARQYNVDGRGDKSFILVYTQGSGRGTDIAGVFKKGDVARSGRPPASSDPQYIVASKYKTTKTGLVQDIGRAREIADQGTIYILGDTDQVRLLTDAQAIFDKNEGLASKDQGPRQGTRQEVLTHSLAQGYDDLVKNTIDRLVAKNQEQGRIDRFLRRKPSDASDMSQRWKSLYDRVAGGNDSLSQGLESGSGLIDRAARRAREFVNGLKDTPEFPRLSDSAKQYYYDELYNSGTRNAVSLRDAVGPETLRGRNLTEAVRIDGRTAIINATVTTGDVVARIVLRPEQATPPDVARVAAELQSGKPIEQIAGGRIAVYEALSEAGKAIAQPEGLRQFTVIQNAIRSDVRARLNAALGPASENAVPEPMITAVVNYEQALATGVPNAEILDLYKKAQEAIGGDNPALVLNTAVKPVVDALALSQTSPVPAPTGSAPTDAVGEAEAILRQAEADLKAAEQKEAAAEQALKSLVKPAGDPAAVQAALAQAQTQEQQAQQAFNQAQKAYQDAEAHEDNLNREIAAAQVPGAQGPPLVGNVSRQFFSFELGRNSSAPIRIQGDDRVSRSHAIVTVEKGQVFIQDNESTNGTFLNEKVLSIVPVAINRGDKIRIGYTTLRFIGITNNIPQFQLVSPAPGVSLYVVTTLPQLVEELMIGRTGSAEYYSSNSTVSRDHARVVVSGQQVTIEDAGSRNGTYVNNNKISKATPLKSGDQVLIGNILWNFTGIDSNGRPIFLDDKGVIVGRAPQPGVSGGQTLPLARPQPIAPPASPAVAAGLQKTLAEKLKEKGQTFNSIASEISVDSSVHAALLLSNKTITGNFFANQVHRNAQNNVSANGYIVGIGVANALSGMHLFDKNSPPKGAILLDVDPRVVIAARMLAKSIARNTTFAGVQADFRDINVLKYFLKQVIAEEANEKVRRQFLTYGTDLLVNTILEKGNASSVLDGYYDRTPDGSTFSANKYVKQSLEDYFDQWKKLIITGKFVSLLADATNATFMKAVAELPDFRTSNNVVYISNATDVVVSFSENKDGITNAARELTPNAPYKNTYLDTLWTNAYVLQADWEVPSFIAIKQPENGRYGRGQLVKKHVAQLGRIYGPYRNDFITAVPIGSSEENGLIIRDSGIASQHARIYWNDARSKWVIEDLKLGKGTTVIRNRTKNTIKQPFDLQNGDEVQLGKSVLRIEINSFPGELRLTLEKLGDQVASVGRQVDQQLLDRLNAELLLVQKEVAQTQQISIQAQQALDRAQQLKQQAQQAVDAINNYNTTRQRLEGEVQAAQRAQRAAQTARDAAKERLEAINAWKTAWDHFVSLDPKAIPTLDLLIATKEEFEANVAQLRADIARLEQERAEEAARREQQSAFQPQPPSISPSIDDQAAMLAQMTAASVEEVNRLTAEYRQQVQARMPEASSETVDAVVAYEVGKARELAALPVNQLGSFDIETIDATSRPVFQALLASYRAQRQTPLSPELAAMTEQSLNALNEFGAYARTVRQAPSSTLQQSPPNQLVKLWRAIRYPPTHISRMILIGATVSTAGLALLGVAFFMPLAAIAELILIPTITYGAIIHALNSKSLTDIVKVNAAYQWQDHSLSNGMASRKGDLIAELHYEGVNVRKEWKTYPSRDRGIAFSYENVKGILTLAKALRDNDPRFASIEFFTTFTDVIRPDLYKDMGFDVGEVDADTVGWEIKIPLRIKRIGALGFRQGLTAPFGTFHEASISRQHLIDLYEGLPQKLKDQFELIGIQSPPSAIERLENERDEPSLSRPTQTGPAAQGITVMVASDVGVLAQDPEGNIVSLAPWEEKKQRRLLIFSTTKIALGQARTIQENETIEVVGEKYQLLRDSDGKLRLFHISGPAGKLRYDPVISQSYDITTVRQFTWLQYARTNKRQLIISSLLVFWPAAIPVYFWPEQFAIFLASAVDKAGVNVQPIFPESLFAPSQPEDQY